MRTTFILKYCIALYMLTKKYTTTHTAKATSPHTATIAKPKEKPYFTHSVSALISTKYGNISFKQ